MLHAIAILLLLQALGDALARLASLPVPGSVVGMVLLFAGLLSRRRVPAGLDQLARAALPHMMLLFIPSVAAVMLHTGQVAREWLPFLLASVAGAVITLVVTAWTLQRLLRRRRIA